MEWYTTLKDFLDRLDTNKLVGLLKALKQSAPRRATRGNFQEATVNALLTTATHNKAFRNELLKVAGIRDVDEEKLQLHQQATVATMEAAGAARAFADEAHMANELAAEANRIAAEANQIARTAQKQSGWALLISIAAGLAALLGLLTEVFGVIDWFTGKK